MTVGGLSPKEVVDRLLDIQEEKDPEMLVQTIFWCERTIFGSVLVNNEVKIQEKFRYV